jgi:hypothetical protein
VCGLVTDDACISVEAPSCIATATCIILCLICSCTLRFQSLPLEGAVCLPEL